MMLARARPLEDGCGGLGSMENPTPTSLDPANKSIGNILVPLPECIIMLPYTSLHKSSRILTLSCLIFFLRCQMSA